VLNLAIHFLGNHLLLFNSSPLECHRTTSLALRALALSLSAGERVRQMKEILIETEAI
jgi:hypothetical protein